MESKPYKMNQILQNKSYTNKCQKHVACSYGYQLVMADKFSQPIKS